MALLPVLHENDPAARRARALRRRFERVSRRIERPVRRRRVLSRLAWAGLWVMLPVAFAIWASVLSPWALGDTIRHLAAMPGCGAARAMDLTPAYKGEPGYWSWLDGDGDGVACEPYDR